ncbi:MAG: OmpA family protein [Bryobacterales bacterium]|nr:OmpA family protein [Bryobacterales bacterium]
MRIAPLVLIAACALAQNYVDHPAVTSYAGSRILTQHQVEFDEYALAVKLAAHEERLKLEGRVTRTQYRNPTGRSLLEIYRNYEGAFQQAGAKIIFTCQPEQCSSWPLYREQKLTNMGNQGFRALVARFVHAGRETHTVVAVSSQVHWVHVVESKPMDFGLVSVDAKVMEDTLGRDGRISLHNILFDTGQSVIRPESQSAIAEIGKLLTGKPDLNLEIVGHTDDTGTEEGNLLLSAARAKSVVSELVRSFKVSVNRLKARGAGQTAPLAANSTVEGRAKNRRVELVAQK